jgi:hypothetical protein
MSNDSSATIVQKVWKYPPSLSELRRTGAHVLKNAGVGYGDYVEVRAAQPFITYLLFLKLADEMTELGFDPPSPRLRRTDNPIPAEFQWFELSSKSGDPPSPRLWRAGELEPSGARETIRKDRPKGGRGGAHQLHYRDTLESFGTEPGLALHRACLSH